MHGWVMRYRTSMRVFALMFAALLAMAALAVSTAPKAHALPSPDCQFSRSHFNQGWSTNFGPGIGVLTYRTYGDLYFWDRCESGWISGTVAIFGDNLDNEKGTWQTRFQYRRNNDDGYRSTDIFFSPYHSEGGWTYYTVNTRHFIDFSGEEGFARSYKVPLRVIFDDEIRAQKREICNRSGQGWNCHGENGF